MEFSKSIPTSCIKRKNLSTETNVQVNKILFEGKKAIGVEYSKNGQVLTSKCNKRVIISAGAINISNPYE